MDTASFQFVAFGLAIAALSNLSSSRTWRPAVLLLASFVLIGMLAPHAVLLLPMGGFLLLGYAGLKMLERGSPRRLVWGVLAVILVYAWLKRYTFLPQGAFLHFPYFTLGLSYIFFRVLHLLIATANGTRKAAIGPGSYLLYTLNFTTLVSGPIQRYDEFANDQFAKHPIPLGPRAIGLQLERIVRGFFKVNVLAMVLHMIQDDALAQMSEPLPLPQKLFAAFRLAVVYPFFLYANFSGYIDIVIALARLLRVRLPENFNRPFSATSFLDFWNRWHITLSLWLRTYVYNPLVVYLMRRIESAFTGVACFFVTFFLIGIWHGRTSEFALFGVLQGGGVAINKLWQLQMARWIGRKGYRAVAERPIYRALARGLTFSWFAFTLFWFWANWAQINALFLALSHAQWLAVWLCIWLAATLVLAAWEWVRAALLSISLRGVPVLTSRYARVVYASLLGLAAFVVVFLLNQPAPGIVYKAF